MERKNYIGMITAGFAAGVVNGMFGGGGGMVLIPLLTLLASLDDRDLFSSSVAVILPICLVSLTVSFFSGPIPWKESIPWLFGSAAGGYFSVRWGNKIPVLWLHRGLGMLIIYGGWRYLC